MEQEDKTSSAIESVELVYSGWTRLYRAKVRAPGGDIRERDIEHHGSGVAVLPFDPNRRTAMLVRQFRPPAAFVGAPAEILEPIAGIIESGTPEESIRREAIEEAGLALATLERIAETWMMPGISTERIHFFLAEYGAADRIAAGGGLIEEGERIEVVEIPLSELARHLSGPGAVDAKLLLLFQALALRRPELFSP